MVAKRFPEAIATLNKALELFPGEPFFLSNLVRAKFLAGDITGAQAELNTLVSTAGPMIDQLQPGIVTVWKGILGVKQGRPNDGAAALQQLETLRTKVVFDPVTGLDLCVGLEDWQCATKWIGRMHDEHSTLFVYTPLFYPGVVAKVPEAARMLADIR